jgi:hypothetical protein
MTTTIFIGGTGRIGMWLAPVDRAALDGMVGWRTAIRPEAPRMGARTVGISHTSVQRIWKAQISSLTWSRP